MIATASLLMIIVHVKLAYGALGPYAYFGGHVAAPILPAIDIGLDKGLKECQRQFLTSRFNCPRPVFFSIVNQGRKNQLRATKEVAFMHAIMNAGVVQSLTTTCESGENLNCSCKPRTGGEFDWTGCQNVLSWALTTAENVLDKNEGRDIWSLINLHNNQVGRKVVELTKQKYCRCHGVSGSCTLKSCWLKLNDFKYVGKMLKRQYKNARKISRGNDEAITKALLADYSGDLVYVDESPDYCHPEPSYGSQGTLGRTCVEVEEAATTTAATDSNSTELDVVELRQKDFGSCQKLCRDCGHTTRMELRSTEGNKCRCTFKWCCKVECQPCPKKMVSVCAAKSAALS